MDPAQIIGIMLVRDDDLFVGQAVENAVGICDRLILCDHQSRDRTPAILREMSERHPRVEFHRISDPAESHELILRYAGTKTWVFGVDGDELYDPSGLGRMKNRILAGEFDRSWVVFGNVLNVSKLDRAAGWAEGFMAPPCRSMTKLYNFAAIDAWGGFCPERLHGGQPVFRSGFSASDRLNLHESVGWDDADFRCLHVCFLQRSSVDPGDSARANLMETQGPSRLSRVAARIKQWVGRSQAAKWKRERYGRGPLVRISTSGFFN